MQNATLLVLLLAASSSASPKEEAALRVGRRLSADFWAGRLDPVWAQMSAEVHGGLGGTPAGLSTARDQLLDVTGGPGDTLAERVGEVQGMQVYLRTFQGKSPGEVWLEQWVLNEGQTVAGFFVRPTELKLEGSLPEAPRPTPQYLLAACLLGGTVLLMGSLSLWFRRSKKMASPGHGR